MRIESNSAPPLVQSTVARHGASRAHGLTWDAVVGLLDPAVNDATALAAASAIGDTASRFDARPIVAPVAEAGAPPTAGASAATCVERRGDAPPAKEAMAPGVTDVANPSTFAVERVPECSLAPMAMLPLTGKGMSPRSAAIGLTLRVPPQRVERAGEQPNASTERPRSANVRQAQATVARIVAFADEIRILVRGVTLSGDVRIALVRSAEQAIAGTPLAGRPIRVIDRSMGT